MGKVAKTTAEEGRKVRTSKSNAEYNELLSKLQDIPTLPIVAVKVTGMISDPKSSGKEIAELLKKDQVLTAKILRLANSSYYAIPGGCTDVQHALAYLGFNTVAQLVLAISVFTLFKDKDLGGFSMLEFWRHALGAAVCTEILARQLGGAKPEEAFTCGLLHDIGKLVLHQIDPDRFREILSETSARSASFMEVEREWDLPGHSFLGEVIATKWGLPQVIRLAVRYHHFDVSRMDSILTSAKPVIHMVRLANALCVKNGIGNSGDCSDGGVTQEMLKALGLRRENLPKIEQQLAEGMERAGEFLNAYR